MIFRNSDKQIDKTNQPQRDSITGLAIHRFHHKLCISNKSHWQTVHMQIMYQGRSAMAMLNGILWYKQIFKETKIQIYQSIIASLLIYGTEVWNLNTKLRAKLLTTEMDFLRSARCLKWQKLEMKGGIMDFKNAVLQFVETASVVWTSKNN